jgi:hypothetical protein
VSGGSGYGGGTEVALGDVTGDGHTDLSMTARYQAVKAGYKDFAHMKKDSDLDPLRDREDFQKLLAELEKKAPPKTEPAPKPSTG